MNTVCLFETLGFVIYPDKSVLTPVGEICFLGFILNSKNMIISLTHDKILNIKNVCTKLIKTKTPTIRSVSEVIGYLVSSLPAIRYGMLHYRSLEIDKNKALKASKGQYNSYMVLSKQAIGDLQWWITVVVHSPSPIYIVLKTDASNHGWGSVITDMGRKANGSWSMQERILHINCLELKAVLFCLQYLCQDCNNKHIRILTDNTSTVSYINTLEDVNLRLVIPSLKRYGFGQ